MLRWCLFAGFIVVLAILAACAPAAVKNSAEARKPQEGARLGTVQKAYRVVLQGQDVPGVSMLGRFRDVLAPKLRRQGETNQYVIRTATGQIMARSDAEFAPGDCVDVVPRGDAAGPAFRYGEADVVRSQACDDLLGT